MALSGSLTTNKYNDDRYYKLSWTATQSIPNNTSTIKWTLSAESGATWDNWYAERTLKLVIGGSTVFSKTDRVVRYDGVIETGEIKLTHNADGSKSFSVSIEVAVYGSSVNVTGSDSFTLDKIPRYATASQSLNSKTETTVKMNWSSDSTIDYIWYSKDNGSNWTGVNVTDGTSGTYTISGLSANTAYKIKTRVRRKDSQLTTDSTALSVTTYQYPHCTSAPNFVIGNELELTFYNPLNRSFDFTIHGNGEEIHTWTGRTGTTYSGVNGEPAVTNLYNSIPDRKSAQYTVTVVYGTSVIEKQGGTYSVSESKCEPTFTTFSYRDVQSSVVSVTGSDQALVKGLSQLAVVIPSANKMIAKNGATPYRYTFSADTLTGDANYINGDVSKVLGVINSAGVKRINVIAYDSRGIPKPAYKDVTVYDYNKPVINASATRLNNFEAQTTISVSGTYSRLTIGGADKNTIQAIQYRYRETGGTWTSWTTLTATVANGTFTCNNFVLNLDNSKSFEFEFKATDKLGTNTATKPVDVGKAVFFVSSNKKTCYINGVEVATKDFVGDAITALFPAGSSVTNALYPVGAVVCMSTNKNPSSIYGGTWTLIDKGFKSYSVFTPNMFTAGANVVADTVYLSRGANTIRIRLSMVVNSALSDTGMTLGTLNWDVVGITGLHAGLIEQMAYRDGGNGGIIYTVYHESGEIQQLDVFDTTSIASGNTFFLDFTFVVGYDRMLDSVCDKFYWKRTA